MVPGTPLGLFLEVRYCVATINASLAISARWPRAKDSFSPFTIAKNQDVKGRNRAKLFSNLLIPPVS